jgi:hypothetical protein
MAKGANDVILRDRLQFDVNATGDTALVYGRIDLSDYVSIVENKGLAIKEVRFMLRNQNRFTGQMPTVFGAIAPPGSVATEESQIKIFATTTAYELVTDIGTASPNVLCVYDVGQIAVYSGLDSGTVTSHREFYGTPDLHPEGYDVVTDLLIGIACEGLTNSQLVSKTLELDVMLIAEPKKITQKDLTQMLTQAQDL